MKNPKVSSSSNYRDKVGSFMRTIHGGTRNEIDIKIAGREKKNYSNYGIDKLRYGYNSKQKGL